MNKILLCCQKSQMLFLKRYTIQVSVLLMIYTIDINFYSYLYCQFFEPEPAYSILLIHIFKTLHSIHLKLLSIDFPHHQVAQLLDYFAGLTICCPTTWILKAFLTRKIVRKGNHYLQ